jgi:hypothetical protein
VLQVNCRSVCNKALEFWNLVDTCNTDVVISTKSWLKEDISNAEIFRTDFTTFRRDRSAVVVVVDFFLMSLPIRIYG